MTPDDSARNRKMRKMMSLNCSICLMGIFGVAKVYRIWTPKGGPPQYWEADFGAPASSYVLRTKKGPLLCHIVLLQFP